jgi:hypothetical protein
MNLPVSAPLAACVLIGLKTFHRFSWQLHLLSHGVSIASLPVCILYVKSVPSRGTNETSSMIRMDVRYLSPSAAR